MGVSEGKRRERERKEVKRRKKERKIINERGNARKCPPKKKNYKWVTIATMKKISTKINM